MKNILWIAPNLNHYKTRLLNRLIESGGVDLTLLAGKQMEDLGHRPDENLELYSKVQVDVNKEDFHVRLEVYKTILKLVSTKRLNVVLMPVEKKHIPIILFLLYLKFLFGFMLISYNHPQTKSSSFGSTLDKTISKILFSLYDRVIFYTQKSMEKTVGLRLINKLKAFYANNTLDTKSIWDNYTFEINLAEPKTLLFIGRLIPSKDIDALFQYYFKLKELIPSLQLIIIGDGPESFKVNKYAKEYDDIFWRGGVIDEGLIANDMRSSHAVFVPGHSGLSIVHSFCYGKPYFTLSSYEYHPPEIEYLQDDINGLILKGHLEEDATRIKLFLNDLEKYTKTCCAAFNKAKELSIENWCRQIKFAMDFKQIKNKNTDQNGFV